MWPNRRGAFRWANLHNLPRPRPFVDLAGISVFEMEGGGAIIGATPAFQFGPARPILIRRDNQGAANAAIRGPCETATGSALVSCLWTRDAARNIPGAQRRRVDRVC